MPYKDPEKKRAFQLEYQRTHRELINAINKRSREKNREKNRGKNREKSREQRLKNPEAARAAARDYRVRNLSKVRKQSREHKREIYSAKAEEMRFRSHMWRRNNPEKYRELYTRESERKRGMEVYTQTEAAWTRFNSSLEADAEMAAKMELDYNPNTNQFMLWLPREVVKEGEITPRMLMQEHGFNFSESASTSHQACCYTDDRFAAATFAQYATKGAKAELASIVQRIEDSRRASADVTISCPADKELWSFQRANIAYARQRTNVLIGDEPGLGKTPTAICLANEMQAKRVLVICPASLRLQWAARVREWTTLTWPYTIHTILNGRHGVHPNAEWTIVSYDLAGSEAIASAILRQHYDLLILDEAHYLKSADAKRTRTIMGAHTGLLKDDICSHAERIIALTGTPLPNRPREAYTLARTLCFDAIDWMSEDSFRERFNPSLRQQTPDGKWYIDERSGRHAELQNRLRANFMTRHLKRDVMTQLKMPVYDLVQVQETAAVKAALKAESLLDIDPEFLEGADAATLGHVAVVRRQMGEALAPQVADYVDTLFDGGEEKLLLFGWHVSVLDILEKKLRKHGLIRIDGSTGAARKTQLIEEFIGNPKIKLALGNLLSLGTGTDGLQHVCCHALIAEPSWTPGENIQGFDRLHRGGQRRTVQGEIFVAPGSFAEKVLASALRKMRVTNKALDKVW